MLENKDVFTNVNRSKGFFCVLLLLAAHTHTQYFGLVAHNDSSERR